MNWRDQFSDLQGFAEGLVWQLSLQTLRGKSRNNDLVPPSLQQDLFKRLTVRHSGSLNALRRTYFDDLDEADFDNFYYGRSLMNKTTWQSNVSRLQREGHLNAEVVSDYQRSIKILKLAHIALVVCRSRFSRTKLDALIAHKRAMLFTWTDPCRQPIGQVREARQGLPPWSESQDYLARRPREGFSIPTLQFIPIHWWADRDPLTWQVAITQYPLKFDTRPSPDARQDAVRLLLDPTSAVLKSLANEPRYEGRLPANWDDKVDQQATDRLEEARRRSQILEKP